MRVRYYNRSSVEGESQFNVERRIGGDSDLSHNGREYAHRLAEYMNGRAKDLFVWTSFMRRTAQTAKHVIGTHERCVVFWVQLEGLDLHVHCTRRKN